jgi:hypothetical protein
MAIFEGRRIRCSSDWRKGGWLVQTNGLSREQSAPEILESTNAVCRLGEFTGAIYWLAATHLALGKRPFLGY